MTATIRNSDWGKGLAFPSDSHWWAGADKLIGRTAVGGEEKKSGPESLTCVVATATFLESAPVWRGCVGPDQ